MEDWALAENDALTLLGVLVQGAVRPEDAARATGITPDATRRALRELDERGVVFHVGNGYWTARQRTCAGCDQRPSKEATVVRFDPETWEWRCKDCEDERIREVERIVG